MTVDVMAYCSESVSPGDYGRCKQPPLSPGEGGWRGGSVVWGTTSSSSSMTCCLVVAAATQAQLQIWQGGGVEGGSASAVGSFRPGVSERACHRPSLRNQRPVCFLFEGRRHTSALNPAGQNQLQSMTKTTCKKKRGHFFFFFGKATVFPNLQKS